MEGYQREFHMEEFRQLKTEISALLLRIGSLFRYSMLSSAFIYSWLLTQAAKTAQDGPCLTIPAELAVYAVWIPPIYIFISFVLARYTYLHIKTVAEYIKEVENALGFHDFGWEKYWSHNRPTLTNFFRNVWLGLLLACAIMSLRLHFIIYNLPSCNA